MHDKTRHTHTREREARTLKPTISGPIPTRRKNVVAAASTSSSAARPRCGSVLPNQTKPTGVQSSFKNAPGCEKDTFITQRGVGSPAVMEVTPAMSMFHW